MTVLQTGRPSKCVDRRCLGEALFQMNEYIHNLRQIAQALDITFLTCAEIIYFKIIFSCETFVA